MDRSASFEVCAGLVRRHDPDRYFPALFAPRPLRPALMALYAFNYEIARVGETVREPMMGEIRLEWWRETVEGARGGAPRTHDVAQALDAVLKAFDLPQGLFDAMIEARRRDVLPQMFESVAALEDYGAGTVGALIELCGIVLGGKVLPEQARAAGIAYALTGLLRAIPHHAARGKLYLPLDLLTQFELTPERIFAGHGGEGLRGLMGALSQRAEAQLKKARAFGRSGKNLSAFLPLALVPLYLKTMRAPGFDVFRHPAEVAPARKHWALLSAATRGMF